MDIVLTGTEEWAIDRLRRSLRAGGSTVRSCFDECAPGAPCNGLAGDGECPGVHRVDVIVSVRAHPLPTLTRHERSVDCPMLADVPLLVAGSTMLNPFGPRASAVIEGVDEVATACHAIASANPLPAQA